MSPKMSPKMNQRVIRYTTKPDCTEENERMIRAVFAEAAAKAPQGVRYLALRLADGTFIHLVTTETDDGSKPLTDLPAFQSFQKDVAARLIAPPQVSEATIVGNYRMLSE